MAVDIRENGYKFKYTFEEMQDVFKTEETVVRDATMENAHLTLHHDLITVKGLKVTDVEFLGKV